mgnify:CR=1 FL=1
MLTYDYPTLGVFWTFMFLALWVLWLVLLIRIVMDLFRNDDMSGWGKAAWLLLLIVLPYLGVLIYLVVHGDDLQARRVEEERLRSAAMREHIAQVANTGSRADELVKFSQLRNDGVITQEEFDREKARLLDL